MNKQREIANPHRNKPNGTKPYKTPENYQNPQETQISSSKYF